MKSYRLICKHCSRTFWDKKGSRMCPWCLRSTARFKRFKFYGGLIAECAAVVLLFATLVACVYVFGDIIKPL